MNFLIIDSTQPKLMILLGTDGERFSYVGNEDARRHASMILEKTDELLSEAGLSAKDIDVFGAVTGPGSFTGIRIGVTTVNALAAAWGKKIIAFSGLETIAEGDDVAALMDCKNSNYYALIRRDGSDEFSAVNEKDLDSPRFEGLKRVYYTEPDPAGAERVFLLKLEKGEFADMARPFYIKKSSAENMK